MNIERDKACIGVRTKIFFRQDGQTKVKMQAGRCFFARARFFSQADFQTCFNKHDRLFHIREESSKTEINQICPCMLTSLARRPAKGTKVESRGTSGNQGAHTTTALDLRQGRWNHTDSIFLPHLPVVRCTTWAIACIRFSIRADPALVCVV
jgi:hypothetical protein